MNRFEPTYAAARERLEIFAPAQYTKTRNSLNGAVTQLSPYITHGIITIPQTVAVLLQRFKLNFDDKIIFELAWREFFHHVWGELDDDIFKNIRPAPWTGRYSKKIPDDVLTATTGIPAIDCAVAQLYTEGYLHNHARMWLASYLVHLRKVEWQVGADWLYSHLLDGDLASNHLSWQWVAATFSAKPYLFNAENVAKYAPANWHSVGSSIDQSYEALDDIARNQKDIGVESEVRRKFTTPINEPAAFKVPPPELIARLKDAGWPIALPADLLKKGMITIVHPWSMDESLARASGQKDRLRLGVIHLPFHAQHPWTSVRWEFVLNRMRAVTDLVFIGDAHSLLPSLQGGQAVATLNPCYRDFVAALDDKPGFVVQDAPRQFLNPTSLCNSFTRYYEQVRRGTGRLSALV
jgi:deoxyribodipyrimidine photo-lyase